MFSKLPDLCYVCFFNNKVEIISENNVLVINTEKICDIIIFNSYIVIFVITNLCFIIYFLLFLESGSCFTSVKLNLRKKLKQMIQHLKNF